MGYVDPGVDICGGMRSDILGYVFGGDESQAAGIDQRFVDDYVVCFMHGAPGWCLRAGHC